jgi:hypothetical protein
VREAAKGDKRLQFTALLHNVSAVLLESSFVVRYADDAVLGFQHRADAEQFLRDWKERLGRFGLELHPDKTRLLEFGRYAVANRKESVEKGSRKRSTSWVSPTSVGKRGRPANSSFYARPSTSGSLPNWER